jgi:hypothetical protein
MQMLQIDQTTPICIITLIVLGVLMLLGVIYLLYTGQIATHRKVVDLEAQQMTEKALATVCPVLDAKSLDERLAFDGKPWPAMPESLTFDGKPWPATPWRAETNTASPGSATATGEIIPWEEVVSLWTRSHKFGYVVLALTLEAKYGTYWIPHSAWGAAYPKRMFPTLEGSSPSVRNSVPCDWKLSMLLPKEMPDSPRIFGYEFKGSTSAGGGGDTFVYFEMEIVEDERVLLSLRLGAKENLGAKREDSGSRSMSSKWRPWVK